MKIKYLGTAAAEGIPGLFCRCDICENARRIGGKEVRTRSQAVIDGRLLIDFPADTNLHLLRDPSLSLPNIRTLLITHSHSDHFYPWDLFVRCPDYAHHVDGPLHIYGNETVERHFRAAAAEEGTPRNLDQYVQFHRVPPFEPFEADGYRITPLLANHDPLEHCYVYVIERDGKRLLYGNDTGLLPERSFAYLRESGLRFDLISLDCTMGAVPTRDYHMGMEATLEFFEILRAAGCVDNATKRVVNHFSHNGRLTHAQYVNAMATHQVAVTYDGYETEV